MRNPVALACPEHQGALALAPGPPGAWRCAAGCSFPVVDGIARFVPQDNYAASFGLQWNTFRRTQLDSCTGTHLSRDRLARIAGGSLEPFRGRDVLEAGCGAGRFTEIMLAAGARVFAADISSAVEANLANCGAAPDYFVCQADITRLPVLPARFDVVVCVGVVQHTPDPERTMAALVSHVKPGGLLLMDHYPPDYPVTPARRLLRWWLLRHTAAYSLRFCEKLISLLWPLHRMTWKAFREPPLARAPLLPRIWSLLTRVSPVVDYQLAYPELGPELLKTWALLDTHDTLTDRYKHLRSREAIEAHLRRCGMERVETALGGNGVEVRAWKPGPGAGAG
jgi:2-polyprenyl-3-methyl-5-hydroxy-6-metoxy-1,4-benzoquinol methylase